VRPGKEPNGGKKNFGVAKERKEIVSHVCSRKLELASWGKTNPTTAWMEEGRGEETPPGVRKKRREKEPRGVFLRPKATKVKIQGLPATERLSLEGKKKKSQCAF